MHMKIPASPTPTSLSGWTRRAWLGGAATLLAAPWEASRAQSAAAAEEEARAPELPALGSRLVVPPVKLLDGRTFDPAQAEGKPLLIYWWASFCPFCALQSPAMEALWRSQRDKGLVMLTLSIDSAPQDATAYLHKKGYTFPAAWTSPEWRRAFPKPKGLPVTLLRGRDGRVALAEKGQMFDEDVAAIAHLV